METFIGVLVGGLITLLVSRWYYRKASEDLPREAGELRRYTLMLIRLLDDAGAVTVEWDPNTGEPRRVVLLSGTMGVGGGMSGHLSVGHQEEPESPAEETEDR